MGDGSGSDATPQAPGGEGEEALETVRQRVEERYDFEHFTPADMAEMTVEEWEAAFDPGAWITGEALLDRVEAELRSRVARRNLFAVVERSTIDGTPRVLAYDDVGYALVSPEGTVTGEGPIVEDVEPVVVLCSMADYEVDEPAEGAGLPDPATISPESGGLGDRLLIAVAVVQVVAGLGLLLAPLVVDAGGAGGSLLTTVAGLGFLLIGVLIGVLVANARLSGRFRAAEYRERLRAAGVGGAERPSFLPEPDGGSAGDGAVGTAEDAPPQSPD